MARIRTIKPEFPHSESMGRISRDARLLFIQLWTLCDDAGRTRGNSRMLASLLFPYDDDAPKLIERWIKELEREGCVVRYVADGTSYMQVCNWLIHQKIDKPSESKIPPFDESSRILANPRDVSCVDQGSRIKDQGVDQGAIAPDGAENEAPKKQSSTRRAEQLREDFKPNEAGIAYAVSRKVDVAVEFESFRNWHAAKGSTMKDWNAAWRTWCDKAVEFGRCGARRTGSNIHDQRAATIAALTSRAKNERPVEPRDITGEAVRVA